MDKKTTTVIKYGFRGRIIPYLKVYFYIIMYQLTAYNVVNRTYCIV